MNQTLWLYIFKTMSCPIYFFCACAKKNFTLQKTAFDTLCSHHANNSQVVQNTTKTNKSAFSLGAFSVCKISVCGVTLVLSVMRCVNYNLIG